MMASGPARAAALAARLDALPAPAERGWLAAAQHAATARLLAMGLPGRRDEYWRYTDPEMFSAPTPSPSEVEASESPFEGHDRLRVVFTDGVLDAQASDALQAGGLEIADLAEAGAADIHWARDLHGQLEAAAQDRVARPFAALNSARAGAGLVIRAVGAVARPVEIISRTTRPGAEVMLRHLLRVDAGARVTIIETDTGAARSNSVIEAEIAEGATLHHIRCQPRAGGHVAQAHLFARLASGAALRSFTLAGSGRLVRNETVIWLSGDNGSAHVAGATLGTGKTLHDDTVFMTHSGRHCESRQVFKKVLDAGAVGVFQGKILVESGAQKTDGYQVSQALLLDDASQALAKPELEIYADDVKCSHGSTSGALDTTSLFYLRSRGVPEAQARALLVQAFLGEAVDEIADRDLAEAISARLASWLGTGQG
jgi:Fe-S cluster assembly protein SufD